MKRQRGRNNGRKPHMPVRSQTFDSSGPDVRIRGNAYQVLEKYLALARDATAAGDRIAAENFYQHAEHYFRLINANGEQNRQQHPHHQHQQREHGHDPRAAQQGFDWQHHNGNGSAPSVAAPQPNGASSAAQPSAAGQNPAAPPSYTTGSETPSE
jgi:hypothetical protein